MSRLSRLGDRLVGGKATTVALIFTPLQAINILEYAEAAGHELALILIGNSTNPRNRQQIAEVLEGVGAKVIQIAGHSGVPLPGVRQDAALAEVLSHLSAIGQPIRMIFGEYRSSLAWRLIRMLDLSGKRVVFVDDGAATLSIDRANRVNDVIPWEPSEAVAPVYGPGSHVVTTASHTYADPREKAIKLRALALGDKIDLVAVIRKGERLWGVTSVGEFVRMGHVLWDAPLPAGRPSAIDVGLHGGTEWSSDANFASVEAVTFFTSYANELRAAPGDEVVANTFPRLRRLYRDLAVDPARIVVIGSPLLSLGLTSERIETYTRELIACARAARPGAEVVYVPHRAESDSDLAYLAGECSIERFDLPFELVPLKVGSLPGLCATFYSSLSLNLLDLAGDRLSVLSLRIDPGDLDESRRETIERVYERIAAHPAGTTQVVASSGGN